MAAAKSLTWAVRLLFLQAAGLAAGVAYLIVRTLTAQTVSAPIAWSLIGFAALGVVFIVAVARALGRRQSGARGPAIVVQLMVIASGGFLIQTGPVWLGIPLLLFGVLVGLLIVLPSSTRELGVG